MNKEEFESINDGDTVENISTGRRYTVRTDTHEEITKSTLSYYKHEFEVVEKVKREPTGK